MRTSRENTARAARTGNGAGAHAGSGTGRRLARRVAKAAALVATFALVNALATFALVPYGSKSQVIWEDYAASAQAGTPVDTVLAGTSFAHHALDPAALDTALGSTSFNLASPNQTVEESFIALQTAYEDFPVKRAVVAVSSRGLHEPGGTGPASTFLRERARAVGALEAAGTCASRVTAPGTVGSAASVNWVFPWIESYVGPNPRAVLANARMKAAGIPLAEAAHAQEAAYTHRGAGFGAYEHVYDPNTEFGVYFSAAEVAGEDVEIDPGHAETLRQMCAWCAERDVELVVIGVPLPAHNIDYYGDGYWELQERIAALLAAEGVPYFDFNCAAPELLQVQDDWFFDYAHMNARGAAAFSTALGGLLAAYESGQDVQGLFYDRASFEAAQTGIDGLMLQVESEAGGVNVSCRALAGPQVQAEYQVLALSEDGTWNEVRSWSTEPECTFTPAQRGPMLIRVNARTANSTADWERYREISAYW